jgi:hypothetical protein
MHFCAQVNTSITELNLARNNFDAEAGKALGKALEVSPIFIVILAIYDGQLDFPFFVLCSAVGEYEYHDAGFDK